ncbi:MAG: chorismate-binding protein [Cytophagales bacterium]|nr:chorismate-binding protein [Cytophagales bacterium]
MRIEAEKATKEISLSDTLTKLVTDNNAFAVWRFPDHNDIHFLFSNKEESVLEAVRLEDLDSGFVVAPFDQANGNHAFFIHSDLYFSTSDFEKPLPEKALSYFEENTSLSFKENTFGSEANYSLSFGDTTTERNKFEALVSKAVEEIKKTEAFEKVVLSRKTELTSAGDFDAVAHFRKICQKYPGVFCSMVFLPSINELWIGASPETLVRQNSDSFFETMALAGTQSAFDNDGIEIECPEALWRQKEIEEQALVSRYIINCFKKIRVREFSEIGPKTVRAGNLLHLQTRFQVDSGRINFPQMASVMLELLHPTSAVCGMPKDIAFDFIQKNEEYDRGFYSGYLGPVNINSITHLFVNLRSLKISGSQITLFAGCGITADSTPEKEWIETEMKLKTIIG